MTTKEKVLAQLLAAQPQPISGQKIATQLGLSRNAVWKAIEDLRQAGYQIDQQGRKGYRLASVSQALDSQQIKLYCQETFADLQVATYDAVTSTNDLAKTFAQDQPGKTGLFIAKQQTQGRGRHGRQFFSGLEHGLYLSLVLKPQTDQLQDLPLYTLMAAAAMTQALENYHSEGIRIKWINDLFYGGKKVAGILCESIMDLESQTVSALVIGIGLNLAGTFDQEDPAIQQVAGTLFGPKLPEDFNPNRLIADFIHSLWHYHQSISDRSFIPYYREKLLGLDQAVTYQKGGETFQGVIRGINEDGNLLIQDPSGQILALFSGEIHFSSQQFAKS